MDLVEEVNRQFFEDRPLTSLEYCLLRDRVDQVARHWQKTIDALNSKLEQPKDDKSG